MADEISFDQNKNKLLNQNRIKMQTVSCFRPMTQDISSPRLSIPEMNQTALDGFRGVKLKTKTNTTDIKSENQSI